MEKKNTIPDFSWVFKPVWYSVVRFGFPSVGSGRWRLTIRARGILVLQKRSVETQLAKISKGQTFGQVRTEVRFKLAP